MNNASNWTPKEILARRQRDAERDLLYSKIMVAVGVIVIIVATFVAFKH